MLGFPDLAAMMTIPSVPLRVCLLIAVQYPCAFEVTNVDVTKKCIVSFREKEKTLLDLGPKVISVFLHGIDIQVQWRMAVTSCEVLLKQLFANLWHHMFGCWQVPEITGTCKTWCPVALTDIKCREMKLTEQDPWQCWILFFVEWFVDAMKLLFIVQMQVACVLCLHPVSLRSKLSLAVGHDFLRLLYIFAAKTKESNSFFQRNVMLLHILEIYY